MITNCSPITTVHRVIAITREQTALLRDRDDVW